MLINLGEIIKIQTASFIFVDSPVGTGYSYSTSSDWSTSDTLSAEQGYQFLRKVSNYIYK